MAWWRSQPNSVKVAILLALLFVLAFAAQRVLGAPA
jgi:hypothetical protein